MPWSVWLAWSVRAQVRAARRRVDVGGLAFVAAGVALLALAKVVSSLALACLSLPVALIGLGRLVLGRQAFHPLLFPTVFLVLMVPLPAEAIPTLSLPLQQLAARFTELALEGVRIPAVREGLFIRLDSAVIHIAEGCSGLRFLLVMIVLGVGSAWAIGRRLRLGLFLFSLAIAAAIGANLVRVAATVILVHFYGIGAVEGSFHSLFGKAVYLVALALFLLAAWRLRSRPAVPDRRPPSSLKGGFCRP